MSQSSTERFTGRVDDYARYRPQYPPQVIDLLRRDCGLRPEHTIADIASGTGIFTRLLLENGNCVFAVEPNAEMRAASAHLQGSFPRLTLVVGTAEATTLSAASVGFITVAQAAHWLDPEQARAEFKRILKPHGWCVLLWNERRITGNPFLDDYEQLLRQHCPEYKDKRHGQTAPIAQALFVGSQYYERIFEYQQEFDFVGLTGRLLSSSYCPLQEDPAHAPMMQELERIFDAHARRNTVRIDYDTRVFFGQLHYAE